MTTEPLDPVVHRVDHALQERGLSGHDDRPPQPPRRDRQHRRRVVPHQGGDRTSPEAAGQATLTLDEGLSPHADVHAREAALENPRSEAIRTPRSETRGSSCSPTAPAADLAGGSTGARRPAQAANARMRRRRTRARAVGSSRRAAPLGTPRARVPRALAGARSQRLPARRRKGENSPT